MRELDGLKNDKRVGTSARETTRAIRSMLSAEQENKSMTNQIPFLEIQEPIERPRGARWWNADEEVLRACELESKTHSQVVLVTGKGSSKKS
jgi:hypothetical protein